MSGAGKTIMTPGLVPGAGPASHVTSVLLPLRFVVAGLLALFCGVGILAARPDILAAYHYNQYVIATTHLFVLGWISTIVMGAMYQLVPVALETRLYSERLARWQFVFHLAGFTGMVWMFWVWNMKQVGHFGTILGVGVSLFLYNIIRTLMRVPRWNVVASSVACALGWLALAILAGLTITAGKCSYEETSPLVASGPLASLAHGLKTVAVFVGRFDQLSTMHAHAHLGVVGVFLMLIVGISYKLLPMFTLSELQNPRRACLSLILLNLGLGGSFFAILLRSPLKFACAVLALAGLAIYGLEVRAIIRARKRRSLDWGVKYFLTALGLLAPLSILSLVLSWPGLPLNSFTGQLENLYGFLALLGVVSFAIVGMLYKIIPFLVWYRSYSKLIGLGKVPALADLYSSRFQAIGYWCYLAGLAVSSGGILLSHSLGVRCGALLLAASLLALGLNAVQMFSHLVRPRNEPFSPAVSKQPTALAQASVPGINRG